MGSWADVIDTGELNFEFLRAEYYAPEYRRLELAIRSQREYTALGSLVKELFQGWSPRGGVKGDAGIPAIKVKSLSGYGLEYEMDRVDVDLKDVPDRAWAKKGDIYVIRCAHHPRYIGLSIDNYLGFFPETPFITEKIIVARGIEDRANASYVTTFLRTRFGYEQVQRRLGGLTANYTPRDFGTLLVALPDRRIQDYIGAKVELAERCRAEAFKAWKEATSLLSQTMGVSMNEETFAPRNPQDISASGYRVASVDPAIARVNHSRITGYIGAQFFHPRRAKALIILEQSDLPTKRLAELANRFAERISAADLQMHGYPYVGLANIDSITGFITDDGSGDISGTCARFQAGDILFSKLRPYLNKVTICPDHIPHGAGSTELVVYRAKQSIDPYFLFFILKSPLVLNQVTNITSGSTHPRIDPDLIDDVLIPLPEDGLQRRIGDYTRKTLRLLHTASTLVVEAKSDIEALIEGTLDTNVILSGKLKPPTWEDIEKELKEAHQT